MKPLVLIVLLVPLHSTWALDPVEVARAHRKERGAMILAEFVTLLEIPNVASDPVSIRRNADFIASLFRRRGAQMEVLEIPGAPPVVWGRLEASDAGRTLGIYLHYDGQPVDETAWIQSPWKPTLYTRSLEAGGKPRDLPNLGEPIDPEWRLYARSAGDDKAPIPALLAALDALQNAEIPRTSNLVFFFEGEEENGSDSLGVYMERYKNRLEVDAWLICDGPVHQSRRPQLVFGVRGYTGFHITIYGATRNLHSGHYGNWAPNPAMMLCQLLAGMKDDTGTVLIEGFYDSVAPLGEAEQAALATVPQADAQLKEEMGLAWTEGEGANLNERLLLPSFNVRGMAAAGVGSLARNVIPNMAQAAVDIRLVKGNDPEAMLDLVETHIRKQGYLIVREDPDQETRLSHPRIAKIRRSSGYVAARTEMDLPIVQSLVEAGRKASGEELILLPSLGGSLPLYLFNQILERPVVIVPIANHDDNQHAPNENLRLANLWYGIDLMAAVLTMP